MVEQREEEDDEDPESQNGGGDEFAGDWAITVVPRCALEQLDLAADEPLVTAGWRGKPVHVVTSETIYRWRAEWDVAMVDVVEVGYFVDVTTSVVDLALTFRTAGISGLDPENVLVVEKCDGVQAGNCNRQLNIHKFTLEKVRLNLDEAFAWHLAKSSFVRTSGTAGRPQDGTAMRSKLIIRNSRGVQVGDHCTQRNLFEHVVTGSVVTLSEVCHAAQVDRLVGKLRAGEVASARRELTSLIRRTLESDPQRFYADVPRPCNVVAREESGYFFDCVGVSIGKSVQKVKEEVSFRNVDNGSIDDWLKEFGDGGLPPVDLAPLTEVDLDPLSGVDLDPPSGPEGPKMAM